MDRVKHRSHFLTEMIYNDCMSVGVEDNDRLVIMAYVSNIKHDLNFDQVRLNQMTTQILGQAHANNPCHGITGVLYYGNLHFFQCLEGKQSAVMDMYNKVKNDHRHTHVTPLITMTLKTRVFDSWSMKFIDSNKAIMNFFQQHGLASFAPEKLKKQELKSFIRLLSQI